jgi:hypothetical protein
MNKKNKVGANKKAPGEAATERITIVVTPNEKESLMSNMRKMGDRSLSAHMRKMYSKAAEAEAVPAAI